MVLGRWWGSLRRWALDRSVDHEVVQIQGALGASVPDDEGMRARGQCAVVTPRLKEIIVWVRDVVHMPGGHNEVPAIQGEGRLYLPIANRVGEVGIDLCP